MENQKAAFGPSERNITISYYGSITVISVMALFSLICCRVLGLERLPTSYVWDVSIDLVAMFVSVILGFSIFFDKPRDKQNRSIFRLVYTLGMLFFCDFAYCYLEGYAGSRHLLFAVVTLLYFCETMLIYCFWAYVREELKLSGRRVEIMNRIARSVLLLDLVLNLLNIPFRFFFSVDVTGRVIEGAFSNTAEITTFLLYLMCWGAIIADRTSDRRKKLILVTFQVFPVVAKLISVLIHDYTYEYPSYLFATLIIYMNVFAIRSRLVLEQQALLRKQQAQLMISQIQPHFLYNVLTTISNLCVKDPEEAEETTILFSQYLRTNLDSLRNTQPVPFGAELGHINTYIELEKKRFKDKLNVEIDCPERNFLVPSLGLQPIVENSIKHGIRGKDTPGHLWITSRKTDAGYEVIIKDDGVGFDPSTPPPEDGKSHVGMINVRSRLQQMCGASYQVESSPGNGCTTTIVFPLDQPPRNS